MTPATFVPSMNFMIGMKGHYTPIHTLKIGDFTILAKEKGT